MSKWILSTGILLLSAPLVQGEDRIPDFDTEIIPVLTRAGCNTGACHGSAAGRGGFRLSLYGGNPAADYEAIVHELEGRRINPARPARSLLVRKPTGQTPHGGGERFSVDSAAAELFKGWIESGAPPGGHRELVTFRVMPSSFLVENPGQNVALKALATFSDGSTRDVTEWSVFTPEDDSAVEIDPYQEKGKSTVVVRRRGEHILHARFLDRVVPVRILVPLSDQKVDHSSQPRNSFIDDAILGRLERLRLPVSPGVNDATYLRRATLDLTGRLPTPDEVHEFSASTQADKRQRLIERLLASEAFTDYWTYRLATLLRIRSQPNDQQAARTCHRWLRRQIAAGTPLDVVARDLLTATGDSHTVGPANFYRTTPDARSQAEFVSEVFMGVKLRCANCHNHPLDRWTQDDYHGLAAVFAKVRRGRVVTLDPRGEVTHAGTGRPARPRIPGERFLDTADGSGREDVDARAVFAAWLTARSNPWFAKAIVNRLWKTLMGRGLVEPVDDHRATNPPTHPGLLNRLAEDFRQHGYRIRHTLRLIAASHAYARASVAQPSHTVRHTSSPKYSDGPDTPERVGRLINRSDDQYYSRSLVRKLPPAVLVDAVCDVTGIPEKFGNQPVGTHAVQLFDPRIPSMTLDILGRCDRSGSCESGTPSGSGLATKLHWINGRFLNRKIIHPEGRLRQLTSSGATDSDIVHDFYLRALSRPPTVRESGFWKTQLANRQTIGERQRALEDFLWSLLSCRAFRTR